MIVKLTSLTLIILIALISLTSAINTKILIKTEPFHNIILRIQSPTTKAEITSLYGKTNISGTLVLDYQANINKLDFLIIARLFGETILTKEFDDIAVSSLITLSTINETAQIQQAADPIPTADNNETAPSLNISANTSNNQSIITNLTASNETSSITGFSISDNAKNIGKKIGYVFIVAVLLAGLVLVFRRARIKRNTQTTFNDEINDIVHKLHEAEREIKSLRNKNESLEQAQKEFAQAREKWERTSGYRYRADTPRYKYKPDSEQHHHNPTPNRDNWNRPQPQKQPENNSEIKIDEENQEQKRNTDSQNPNNPF